MSLTGFIEGLSRLNDVAPVLRATLTLAMSAALTALLMRCVRPRSWRLRTAAWMFVLLQGCLVWTWPVAVAVAWKTSNRPLVQTREAPRPAGGSEPEAASTRGAAQPAADGGAITPNVAPARVGGDLPIVRSRPAPANHRLQISWPAGLGSAWLIGALWFAIRAGRGRRWFLRLLDETIPAPAEWQAELQGIARDMRLRTPPVLHLHETAGPCLTWRSGGYLIVAPQELWSAIPRAEARLILRHELAHVRRGDLWRGLAARMVATLHWFNPCAWLAVRRLEECAEWACDEAACGIDSADVAAYSRLLILLRMNGGLRLYGPSLARGDTVAQRVRRLLHRDAGDSNFRRGLFAAAILLALVGLRLEFHLQAADQPQDQSRGGDAAALAAAAPDGSEPFAIVPPGGPDVVGRPRPEGLLVTIGDDRDGLSDSPAMLALTTDGSRLFAVTTSDVVDVFDAKTLRLTECIRSPGGRVLQATPSPDGKRLAIASNDGSLRIWDVSNRPAQIVSEMSPFVPGKYGVWLNSSASTDRTRFCLTDSHLAGVFEWTSTGLRTVFEHKEEMEYLSAYLSPSGRLVVTHHSGELVLWDLTNQPAVKLDRFTTENRSSRPVAFRDDEMLVLSGSDGDDRPLELLLCAGGRLRPGFGPISGFAAETYNPPVFFDDGRRCVIAERNGETAVVDCSDEDWRVEQTLGQMEGLHCPAAVSPDSLTIYVTSDQRLSTWNRDERGWTSSKSGADTNRSSRLRQIAFLADGETLIFSSGKALHAYSTADPRHPRSIGSVEIGIPANSLSGLFPHPTRPEFLICGSAKQKVVADVQLTRTGLAVTDRVEFGNDYKIAPWCAGYSPDGRTVAIGFWNGATNLYELSDGKLKLRSENAREHGGHVCVLAFSPDGRRLARGDFAHQLTLFDVHSDTLDHEQALEQHGEAVRNAVFTPDGHILVSGSQNGEIRLNDFSADPPATRLLLYSDQQSPDQQETSGGVASMELVAGGRLLMTSSGWKGGRRVALWSMPDGRPLQMWEFPGWGQAAINAAGTLVAVARGDGAINLLEVSAAVRAEMAANGSRR